MTFHDFYQRDYLPRHPTGVCRLFHLLGLLASLVLLGVAVWLRVWWLLLLLPAPAYLIAWLGHLAVPNHPTFFEHPVWSFFGYWKMLGSMLAGKLRPV
jgi:hypothetical protein